MMREVPYVTFRLLRPDAIPPSKRSLDAAGIDLSSAENITLSPGSRAWISTGIVFNIPRHLYGHVHSRSGLASIGIDVAAGIIDPDYQGETRVLLVNNSSVDFTAHHGDRIAQILFIRILNQRKMYPIDQTPPRSARGASGYGSTGIMNESLAGSGYLPELHQQQFVQAINRPAQPNHAYMPRPVPDYCSEVMDETERVRFMTI